VEGTTTRGRTLYVNEAWRDNNLVRLTCPPSPLGRFIFFSEEDTYTVHVPHNDALFIVIHIGCCRVSKILVNRGSNVNILYRHALYQMEDTPKLTQKMIIPQTQLILDGFDGSEAQCPDTVEFPIRVNPYNIITEFCILDVESPYNTILRRPWIHIIRAIPSIHHQLLKYPTLLGMACIRGDQATTRTLVTIARKRSGWAQRASRASPNGDSPMDKKQKRIADQ